MGFDNGELMPHACSRRDLSRLSPAQLCNYKRNLARNPSRHSHTRTRTHTHTHTRTHAAHKHSHTRTHTHTHRGRSQRAARPAASTYVYNRCVHLNLGLHLLNWDLCNKSGATLVILPRDLACPSRPREMVRQCNLDWERVGCVYDRSAAGGGNMVSV